MTIFVAAILVPILLLSAVKGGANSDGLESRRADLLSPVDQVCDTSLSDMRLTPFDFQLAGRSFTIALPPTANVQSLPSGDDFPAGLVIINLRPGLRHSPQISLSAPIRGEGIGPFDRTASLCGSGSLAYLVRASQASGSGEPEAHLEGQMVLSDRPVSVTCSIQEENVTLEDADWCLDLLQTIVTATD